MQVNSVSVAAKAVIPTQAYGSFTLEVMWHAELDEGENPEDATQELHKRIVGEISDAVRPIAEQKGKQLLPYLNRLPRDDQKAALEMMGPLHFLKLVAPVLGERLDAINQIEAGLTPPPADNGAGALKNLKTAVAEESNTETDDESEKEE